MPYNMYPYELPPLPYSYNAMEPFIDAETMHIHHDKHFQAYIDHLNDALTPYPALQKLTLEQLLQRKAFPTRQSATAILHNAGGVYNHSLFFRGLAPTTSAARHRPNERLNALIQNSFGSYSAFQDAFAKQALDVFGSGYACLALTPGNRLELFGLANQDTAARLGVRTLMLLDVWEHAYYLKYKNARAEYVNNAWNVLTFLTD